MHTFSSNIKELVLLTAVLFYFSEAEQLLRQESSLSRTLGLTFQKVVFKKSGVKLSSSVSPYTRRIKGVPVQWEGSLVARESQLILLLFRLLCSHQVENISERNFKWNKRDFKYETKASSSFSQLLLRHQELQVNVTWTKKFLIGWKIFISSRGAALPVKDVCTTEATLAPHLLKRLLTTRRADWTPSIHLRRRHSVVVLFELPTFWLFGFGWKQTRRGRRPCFFCSYINLYANKYRRLCRSVSLLSVYVGKFLKKHNSWVVVI